MEIGLRIDRKIWILLFACSSMFALGIADNIRGPLFAELIKAFDLTNTRGSLSYATTSTFGLLGNITSAWLMRKLRIQWVLIGSLFLMFLGMGGMGLSGSFSAYLFFAAIFGLSMGYMGVSQNVLVAENFSAKEQTKALSGLHGLYGFSSLLAPLIAASATAYYQNWQSGLVITGLIALSIFLLSGVVHSRERVDHVETTVEEKDRSQVKPRFIHLLALGGVLAFYVVAELLVSTRLALYMRQYHDMDLNQSSLYVTYFFICLLLGRIVFALKHFSWPVRKQLNLMLVLSAITLAMGLFVHPFFLVLTGLMMSPYYPMSLVYISEKTGHNKRTYITFAIALQSFMIITMHMGVGWLTDLFGLNKAFYVGLLSLGAAVLCLNFHPQDDHRGSKNESHV